MLGDYRGIADRTNFAAMGSKSLKYGGRTWARTKDPLIKSQLLYQLSYASISGDLARRLVARPLREVAG
jgi:hypothetical protein